MNMSYIILDKDIVFIFAYMALVKYRPMFKMARHRKYRLVGKISYTTDQRTY